MNRTNSVASRAQLAMSGMPAPRPPDASGALGCCKVVPGQEVTYLGDIRGGPHYGARGIVKQTLRQKAIVDMGRLGTWHIPYYFLGLPRAA